MAQTEIITGIDIGSANIRIAVGEVSPDTEKLNIIGLSEGESNGVARGTIRSIEEVVDSASERFAKHYSSIVAGKRGAI